MVSEGPARKNPEGKAGIHPILPDEREKLFSPLKEKTSDSESVERPERIEMDQRFI
jgi:hypothetical protein